MCHGSGECACPPGFSGATCAHSECSQMVCEHGGTCLEGHCICVDGYLGNRCQFNLCDDYVTCHNGGTCNLGRCTCAEGFTGSNCLSARYVDDTSATDTLDQHRWTTTDLYETTTNKQVNHRSGRRYERRHETKPINYRSTTGRWYDRRHETTTDKPVNMVNVISTTERSHMVKDYFGFDYNYDSTDNGAKPINYRSTTGRWYERRHETKPINYRSTTGRRYERRHETKPINYRSTTGRRYERRHETKPINYRSTTGRWYDRRHETTTDKPVNMVNVISTTEESSTMEDDYGFDYNYDSTDNGTDEGTMVRNNNLNKHECWPMRH